MLEDDPRLSFWEQLGLLRALEAAQRSFGWSSSCLDDGCQSLGLRPGRRHALAAGTAETAGGAMLALGLATPLAVATLIAVMSTAVRKVHLQNGIWVSEGGFEYNAVLIAALTLLAETGPGRLSLDAAFGIEKRGVRWGLAALTGGAIASATTIKLSQSRSNNPSGDLDPEGGSEAPEAVASAT